LRKTILIFVWLVILAIAFGAAAYFWLYFVYIPQQIDIPNQLKTAVEFEIKSGEGITTIAQNLEKAGVVNSAWVLESYLKQENLDSKVEAGYFNFKTGETIAQVAQEIQHGGVKQIAFTVLEGWNANEIDAKLVSLGLVQPNDFALFVREGGSTFGNRPEDFSVNRPVTDLEGYLFPATYMLDPKNFSVDDLVAQMLTAMDKNLKLAGYDAATSKRSLHQILTMASLVELEERSEANRPIVADILWRRLDAGWQLGVDATLFYVLGHKENLTQADLASDNPYNTRINRGLPPTPICAPSLSAIKAALNPEANDYWYYLHDMKTGEAHFAKTLEEHNANKNQYIQQD
jgi:UPF0755 protein